VLRLEAPRNRIRTVEKKLGGVPRLHRLQLVDLNQSVCGIEEEIGIATAHEKRRYCRLAWSVNQRIERYRYGSELLGAVQQKTAFAERESLLTI